jgi:predicted aspartyl protease/tetratricopeptide (TPR) repeat protein
MLERSTGWLAIILALPLLSRAGAEEQCHILRSPPIPVSMVDRQPVISAKLNGVDARFMVDTGSSFQILYPSAAAQFKLRLRWAPGLYTLGVGGYDRPNVTTVERFALGSIQVPNVQFLVTSNDLSQAGIAGLLGENLFQFWDEEFDFANGVMRLVQPQHCGGKVLAYWAANQPVAVVDLRRRIAITDTDLVGNASVNGQTIQVLFDTGASQSMLSLEAARRIGITPDSPGVVLAGTSEGFGQQLVETWIAPIADFEIGGEQIEHTHVEIGQLHSRYDDPSDRYDMLLGADFFLAHHVYVANGQSKLYFTYNGGPVFDVNTAKRAPAKSAAPVPAAPAAASAATPSAALASNPPASASDLMRQGLAAESRGLLDQAAADLTRACGAAPHDLDCLYQLGLVQVRLHQQDAALHDFDTAIQLAPDDYQARLARAELQLPRIHAGARADLDAVDRLAPQPAYLRIALGELYNTINLYPQAIRQVTLWMGYHPEDVQLRTALSDRCWYRAEADQELREALKDCSRALRFAPEDAQILDSRALVHLRLGETDEALADYDAALKKNPKLATSLFGRALAELKKGDRAAGGADIAAAETLDPTIARFFASIGLQP